MTVTRVVLGILLACCLAVTARGAEDDIVSSRPEQGAITDLAITRTGTAVLLTVTADRPFIYSYYPLASPPRVVVELAMTAPGPLMKPLVPGTGVLKQVRLIRHEVASGALSRLECFLTDAADVHVSLSPADSRKLLVTFTPNGQKSPAPPTVTPAAAPPTLPPVAVMPPPVPRQERPVTVPPAVAAAPAVITPEPQASQPVQPSAERPAGGAPAAPVPSKGTVLTLLKVQVTPEGIDLVLDGPPVTYAAFPLDSPNRMVVDLPGVLIGDVPGMIPLNAFGIERARVGQHRGKSRIVFEGRSEAVLRTKLIWRERGFRLQPAAPAGFGQKP